MLVPIKNRQKLEDLEEIVLSKNQVEEVRLQGKLGKQNFHKKTKISFEPLTDTTKNTSESSRKTFTGTSISTGQ